MEQHPSTTMKTGSWKVIVLDYQLFGVKYHESHSLLQPRKFTWNRGYL